MKQGSAGGQETLRRHGREHMATIGRAGFAATVARHFGGSKAEYLAHQRALANEAVAEALADVHIRAEVAAGRSACIEMGPLPDYEPQSWRERVSRREGAEVTPW